MSRPAETEYPIFYHNYVSKTTGNDIIKALEDANAESVKLLKTINDEKGTYAYADDKWILNEVIQHMIDTERVFAYRMMRISRGDKTPLPGFEQDDYVPNCNIEGKKLTDLMVELTLLRISTVMMAKSFSNEMLKRTGTASNGTVSVRAIGFIIAGHEIHHMQVIKEKYI